MLSSSYEANENGLSLHDETILRNENVLAEEQVPNSILSRNESITPSDKETKTYSLTLPWYTRFDEGYETSVKKFARNILRLGFKASVSKRKRLVPYCWLITWTFVKVGNPAVKILKLKLYVWISRFWPLVKILRLIKALIRWFGFDIVIILKRISSVIWCFTITIIVPAK